MMRRENVVGSEQMDEKPRGNLETLKGSMSYAMEVDSGGDLMNFN